MDIGGTPKKKGINWKAVAGAAAVALILIVIMFVFAMSGYGPQKGSSDPRTITVGPTSPVIGMLNDLSRYSKPDDFLNKNSGELDKLLESTKSLQSKLNSNDSAFSSFTQAQRDEFKATLEQLITQIQQVQQNISSDKKKAKEAGVKAIASIKKLNGIAATAGLSNVSAELVKTAIAAANYNAPDNNKIAYVWRGGHGSFPLSGSGWPSGLDCSGFINFLMYKAGVFKSPAQASLSVAGYQKIAQSSNGSGFTFVYNSQDVLTGDKLLTDGKIKPGDIILMKSSKSQTGNHVGIYVGGTDTNKNAVHSSGTKSGGPQFASLGNWKNIFAVVRPPGV